MLYACYWFTQSIGRITSRESFDAIPGWLSEARDNVLDECIFCLIGNKSDVERQVEYDEGIKFINDNRIDFFFETSAKSNHKVTEMFETTAQELLQKSLQVKTLKEKVKEDLRLQDGFGNHEQKRSCCKYI